MNCCKPVFTIKRQDEIVSARVLLIETILSINVAQKSIILPILLTIR